MIFEKLESAYYSYPEDVELEWCSCGKELIDIDEQDKCDVCLKQIDEIENE